MEEGSLNQLLENFGPLNESISINYIR